MQIDYINKVLFHDVKKGLPFPDNSIDTIVTSPPYWNLRDYGTSSQLGLEKTPEAYVRKMVKVFREARRVLKKNGTLWLNIGDSYAGSGKAKGDKGERPYKQDTNRAASTGSNAFFKNKKYKPKDLIGIPWMLAFALRADGWFLRQDIIWNKPNPMPESVTDRCTKSHEYIFLLSKSPRYYFNAAAIKTEIGPKGSANGFRGGSYTKNDFDNATLGKRKTKGNIIGGSKHKNLLANGLTAHIIHRTRNQKGEEYISEDGKANKRSVWTVSSQAFKDAHFATFPEDLIVDCIKAGCPPGGIVADIFAGSGTTPVVAHKLGFNYTGCDNNAGYIKLYEKRMHQEFGMFNPLNK